MLRKNAAQQGRPGRKALSTLRTQMQQHYAHSPRHESPLQTTLREHELELIGSAPQHHEPATDTFRSAQRLQNALDKVGVNQVLNRAQRNAPTESGPLNPQKLSVQALLALRHLSPAYLQQLIAHIDTLFCLEQAASERDT